MKCCCGKVLHVDLSTGKISVLTIPDEVYEKVLSGKGLGVWYLMRHIPAGADALGQDNILGFTSGALTGTGALMTGRWTIVCKSPLTGGWGDASCGGTLSPAIKQCGYDAIFFSGKSDKPVYLYADNKGVEIRDANAYWGKDAVEAEEALRKDTWITKRPEIALIGLGGEKLSLISGVCNEGGRIAARSGVGAVMGSKKLKALVLAGSKPMPCADMAAVHAVSRKFGMKVKKSDLPPILKGSMIGFGGKMLGALPFNLSMDGMMLAPLFKKWGTPMNTPLAVTSGDGPIKNWGGTLSDAKLAISAYNPDKIIKREEKKFHCYSCPLGCGGLIEIKDLGGGKFERTHKPEYETINSFGPLLLNNDLGAVLLINEMLNRAGIDSISAGGTVAYAIECFENGIITKEQTDGLELTWGNTEAIVELVHKIIQREGIGNILADGCKRASVILGGEEYAIHIGGQEPGQHDSRNDPQLAVHFVAEPAPGKHTTGMTLEYGAMSLADFCTWAPPMTILNKKDDIEPNQLTAMRSVAAACYTMLADGLGGCYYAQMLGVHAWNPRDLVNAAAAWTKSGDDYMEIGKRIQTLRQLFNIKHGVDPRSFKLPKRMAGDPPLPSGPLAGVKLKNEEMLQLHWACFGWDKKTGVPLQETKDALGIDDLLAIEEGVS